MINGGFKGAAFLCGVIMGILCLRKQSLIFIIIANYWAECWWSVLGCQHRPVVLFLFFVFFPTPTCLSLNDKCKYIWICLKMNLTYGYFPLNQTPLLEVNIELHQIQCVKVSKGCSVLIPADKASNFFVSGNWRNVAERSTDTFHSLCCEWGWVWKRKVRPWLACFPEGWQQWGPENPANN